MINNNQSIINNHLLLLLLTTNVAVLFPGIGISAPLKMIVVAPWGVIVEGHAGCDNPQSNPWKNIHFIIVRVKRLCGYL